MDQNTQQRIDDLVKQNDIVLFMKGNASFPMCGFSGRAIQILKASGVEPAALTTVNVLEDEAVRQGIKEYSQWPTIPQLYVKGEFVGGSDIMMDVATIPAWQIVAHQTGWQTVTKNRDRGAAIVAAAPPTPPGMRVRTGRFERLRS